MARGLRSLPRGVRIDNRAARGAWHACVQITSYEQWFKLERSRGMRLTDEQQRLIIGAIEAGATDYVAAQTAGISPRTFREMMQRADGRHPSRGRTPELQQFARVVNEARARVRAKLEIEIARNDAKHWLRYQARSVPGLDGWIEPVPEVAEQSAPVRILDADDLREVVVTLVNSGAVHLPKCADPVCTCTYHALDEEVTSDEAS